MQKIVKEFRDFVVTGNVIDLAVAVIMGGLLQRIVQALVDYVLLPIIGIIFGLSVAVVVVLKTLALLAGALVGAFVFG